MTTPDFLKVIPRDSGNHNICQGTRCVLGIDPTGFNTDIGSVVVQVLTSTVISVNGSYKYDIAGQSGQGDFNLSLQIDQDGTAKASLNGASYSGQCSADGDSIQFRDLGALGSFALTSQEDTMTQKAKIWLKGVHFQGARLDVYLYNDNY